MIEVELIEHIKPIVDSYRPNPEVQEKLHNVTLVPTVGPSGVGKTTLMREVCKNDWHFAVGDTIRDMRPDEENGVDYHFRRDFDQIWQEVQQGMYANINVGPAGQFYGYRGDAFEAGTTNTCAIVARVIPYYERLELKKLQPIFIAAPNFEEWMRRLHEREKDDEKIRRRLVEARESLTLALGSPEYLFVLNDNVETAVADLKAVAAGTLDTKRQAEARQAAEAMLIGLG